MAAVDAHVHLYRTEQQGVQSMGGSRLAGLAGVVEELNQILDRGRISRAAITTALPVELWRRALHSRLPNVASERERVRLEEEVEETLIGRVARLNQWVCELASADTRVEAVPGADATLAATATNDLKDMIDRHRVKAIKIHPALNYVMPGDPRFKPIFEISQDAGIVVITHGGGSSQLYPSEIDYCAPGNFRPVLESFPQLRLVVAHFGHPYVDDMISMAEKFPNLWTDLSFVLGASLVDGDKLGDAIRSFGVERVLFGSDFPFFDPEGSLDALSNAGLSEGEFEMVTRGNFENLMGES